MFGTMNHFSVHSARINLMTWLNFKLEYPNTLGKNIFELSQKKIMKMNLDLKEDINNGKLEYLPKIDWPLQKREGLGKEEVNGT